jgi:hypothetical protein
MVSVQRCRSSTGTAGYDELNKVTQSGLQKMVRMGDWKLIYDMMGYGQLYHLPLDRAVHSVEERVEPVNQKRRLTSVSR